MILADPEMKLIFAKIGNVSQKIGAVVMKGLPGKNPTHVRPEAAVARGVRIARLVGQLMMNAMRGHPEDRTAFQRQRGADGQNIFQPLGALVAAMGQQTVITHADAQAARNPVHNHANNQRLPTEHE